MRLTAKTGEILYELHALAVAEVRLQQDKGKKCLEVQFSERDCLRIAVRPEIRLVHNYNGNP